MLKYKFEHLKPNTQCGTHFRVRNTEFSIHEHHWKQIHNPDLEANFFSTNCYASTIKDKIFKQVITLKTAKRKTKDSSQQLYPKTAYSLKKLWKSLLCLIASNSQVLNISSNSAYSLENFAWNEINKHVIFEIPITTSQKFKKIVIIKKAQDSGKWIHFGLKNEEAKRKQKV